MEPWRRLQPLVSRHTGGRLGSDGNVGADCVAAMANEASRSAGARRDWERFGWKLRRGRAGTGGEATAGGSERAQTEPERNSATATVGSEETRRVAPRLVPPALPRQCSQRAPHTASSARKTSAQAAQLPFRPRPRPGFPLGLLVPSVLSPSPGPLVRVPCARR